MMPFDERSRRRVLAAGAVLLILALVLPWALSRKAAPRADDPEELLRRASSAPEQAVAATKGVPKTFKVEGTSSSGPIEATLTKVGEGGRAGFVPALATPLKEGESAKLKMPGGGTITIKAGKSFRLEDLPPANRPPSR